MHEAIESALLVPDTQTTCSASIESCSQHCLCLDTHGWPQVNLKTSNGSTALHNAASSGHADVMRLLIAANCNVNIHTLGSASALYNAATGGESASLQTAESVCIKGCYTMAEAATHGHCALCSCCPTS